MKKLLTVLQKIVLIVTQKNFITQTVKNLLDIYTPRRIKSAGLRHIAEGGRSWRTGSFHGISISLYKLPALFERVV